MTARIFFFCVTSNEKQNGVVVSSNFCPCELTRKVNMHRNSEKKRVMARRLEARTGSSTPACHSHVCCGRQHSGTVEARQWMVWMEFLDSCVSSTTPRPACGALAQLSILPSSLKSQNVRELTHLLSLGPEVGGAATAVPEIWPVVILCDCCGRNTLSRVKALPKLRKYKKMCYSNLWRCVLWKFLFLSFLSVHFLHCEFCANESRFKKL